MSMSREMALGSAINHYIQASITSRNPKDVNDQLRVAAHLAAILHEQCSAYHVALARIVEIAKQGGMTERDIFNVTDNLDQPI